MSKVTEISKSATKASQINLLVVDLDGTLIKSDMLFETFWSSFASDWRIPILAIRSLMGGRAKLKEFLANKSHIDVETLPYEDKVVEYIKNWRNRGGKAILVTATDQKLADRIATYLGIFDAAYGSDGTTNLKGPRKAALLADKFENETYAYMGNASADIPVWEHADKAITVNASLSLRRRVEKLNAQNEHLANSSAGLGPYILAMRPHQWLKNILVFLPMLAAHRYMAFEFFNSLLAFVSFCLIASSVYVLNDLLDLTSDRAHPRKFNRPFASGTVPLAHGTMLAPVLFALGIGVAFAIGQNFVLVMLGYYAVTTAYSLYLKRHTIIDICILAGLYTMRILAGGVATELELSVWILAFSIFFFFTLAAVKRQAELVDGIALGRLDTVGRGYNVDDLPLIASMAAASGYVSVLVFALYLNSPIVSKLYSLPLVLWGICPILLYWVSRMIMKTHRGNMTDDPLVFAFKDRVSLTCFLLIAVIALVATLA
ncbi:MAG: UbiA family prenyltransferase [Paracoccaceae bacterium]